MRGVRRGAWAACALAGTWFVTSRAAAAEEPEVPGDAMLAPPTLPALTHPGIALELEYLGAGVGPAPLEGFTDLGTAFSWMTHVEGEVAFVPRKWFFGGAWDVASAAAPGIGRALIYANPEAWVRAAASHASGLVAGGGLGLMVPLPRDDDPETRAAEASVRVVRAWDAASYSSDLLTVRPAFDMRWSNGTVTVQFRSGLDVSYDVEAGGTEMLARAGLFGGYQPVPEVCVGAELWEVYPLTQDIPDDERAAFTLAPSVRFDVGPLEPGVSVLFPLSTPLEGVAEGFFAVRLHVRLAFEFAPPTQAGERSTTEAARRTLAP